MQTTKYVEMLQIFEGKEWLANLTKTRHRITINSSQHQDSDCLGGDQYFNSRSFGHSFHQCC